MESVIHKMVGSTQESQEARSRNDGPGAAYSWPKNVVLPKLKVPQALSNQLHWSRQANRSAFRRHPKEYSLCVHPLETLFLVPPH